MGGCLFLCHCLCFLRGGGGGVFVFMFFLLFFVCLFVVVVVVVVFLGGVVCLFVCLFVFPFCSSAGRKSGPFVWLKCTELERALCVGVGSLVSFGQGVFF